MKGKRFLSIWAALIMAALVLTGCDDGGGGGGGFATPSYKSIDEVEAYLRDASGETSVDTPVALRVELDLAIYWAALLEAIAGAGKYVALDLSRCTLAGNADGVMEFDPGEANTGENMIVSLVLPDMATSIKAGEWPGSGYGAFTDLERVSGSHIETVGAYAFYGCALTTVNLPKATTIGEQAFKDCTTLTSVYLPAAASIGGGAFEGCTSLTTVSLPEATSIDWFAFNNCTSLTSVSLPKAPDINLLVFAGCTALTSVYLPAAASIGGGAFTGCTSLATVSLPVATSIGDAAFKDCNTLTTVDLPKATHIYEKAFEGCTSLATVTLGSTAPTLGTNMFYSTTATVTVKIPNGATGYGDNWKRGFQGAGWNGTATTGGSINSGITLVIQYQ
jgi:hypothetical protein